jgi:multiple sugar transport system substrate-binding protein
MDKNEGIGLMSGRKGFSRRSILGMGLVGSVSALTLAACGEETVIEREVIKEVPVDRIVTVKEEVPVEIEVVREVIKEVEVEVAARPSTIDSNISATIVIFDFGGESDALIYADAHRRFNDRFPNVEIVDNFTPVSTWSEYSNKVAAQIASGSQLDIVNIAIEGTRLVVGKGVLEPLDDLVRDDPEGQEMMSDLHPACIEAHTVNGRLYQIPHSWNNMVIHYNFAMFEEMGVPLPEREWKWADFLESAAKLTSGEGADETFGFGIPNFNFGLHPWFLTNDTYQLNDDWTESNLDDPAMTEAMAFVKDLVWKHEVSFDVSGTGSGQSNNGLFSAGKLGMSGWGHWPIQSFIASDFDTFDVQYWPGQATHTTVAGFGGWGISTSSENKELSWELIKELNSLETIRATARAGVAVPARRSVAESPEFLAFPANSKIFYESLDDMKFVASPENFNELETIFMRHFGEMMSNAKTAEEAMADAHDELQTAMERLKG